MTGRPDPSRRNDLTCSTKSRYFDDSPSLGGHIQRSGARRRGSLGTGAMGSHIATDLSRARDDGLGCCSCEYVLTCFHRINQEKPQTLSKISMAQMMVMALWTSSPG
jgi:hypothetical protein